MKLTLYRAPSGQFGTFGMLFHGEVPLGNTLEPEKPIAPIGIYNCKPHSGPKFKDVWEIMNVPGHTDVLIHNGNTKEDTVGCIVVGESIGNIDGFPAVRDSMAMIQELQKYLPKKFELEIKEFTFLPHSPKPKVSWWRRFFA